MSEQISERTKEFIAANAGADLTRKLGGQSKLSSTELALIVKSLPVRSTCPDRRTFEFMYICMLLLEHV